MNMRNYKYYSTKTYGHEEGLSCMFRQPLATHSHCSLLHGYALSFSFKFGCNHLDDKNWVVDFGDLKDLKAKIAIGSSVQPKIIFLHFFLIK